jgi:hypothetical protein
MGVSRVPAHSEAAWSRPENPRRITSIMPAERPSLLIRRLTTTLRFQVVSDNTNPKDGGEHGHFND